jgi:tetratricopeptide (TPR) repeat protein
MQLSTALDHLKTAIRVDPAEAKYRHSLGKAYEAGEQWQAALDQYKVAVDKDPFITLYQMSMVKPLTRLRRLVVVVEVCSSSTAARNGSCGHVASINLRILAAQVSEMPFKVFVPHVQCSLGRCPIPGACCCTHLSHLSLRVGGTRSHACKYDLPLDTLLHYPVQCQSVDLQYSGIIVASSYAVLFVRAHLCG